MPRLHRLLASFFVASLLLVGCGGGGDGGSDTIHVTYSAPSVSKQLLLGNPDSVVVSATLSSVPTSGTVYLFVLVDRAGLLAGSAFIVQTAAKTFEVTLPLLDTLAVGTYTGAFTFRLCRDPSCASEYDLTGTALPYTIQVWPRVTIDILQGGVLSHNAEVGSHRVAAGEQVTLTSNVPVAWSKGSSIVGNDFTNVTATSTTWTGQIVGTPGGFVGVVAQSLAVGDAQQVIFDIGP